MRFPKTNDPHLSSWRVAGPGWFLGDQPAFYSGGIMGENNPLLKAIANATKEDLDEITARIEKLENELAGLRQLRRVLDVILNGHAVTKAKRGGRKKQDQKEENGAISKTESDSGSVRHQRRLAAAQLLLRGPLRPSEIASGCEIPMGSITVTLDCPWFRRLADGTVGLTTDGRAAVAGRSPAA